MATEEPELQKVSFKHKMHSEDLHVCQHSSGCIRISDAGSCSYRPLPFVTVKLREQTCTYGRGADDAGETCSRTTINEQVMD